MFDGCDWPGELFVFDAFPGEPDELVWDNLVLIYANLDVRKEKPAINTSFGDSVIIFISLLFYFNNLAFSSIFVKLS